MSFSTLPCSIRKEIIRFVIEDRLEYRSLSKEWFECLVSRHGKFVYSSSFNPFRYRAVPSVIHLIETVRFNRYYNIDWTKFEQIKNIRHASLYSNEGAHPEEYKKFIKGFSQFTSLRSLSMDEKVEIKQHIPSILKGNLHSLKKLELQACLEDWVAGIKDLIFLSLSELKTVFKNDLKTLSGIKHNFPNLKRLALELSDLEYNFSSFDMAPSVVSLALRFIKPVPGKKLLFDLSSFPNVRTLTTPKFIEFSNLKSDNNLENLVTKGNITLGLLEKFNLLTQLSSLTIVLPKKPNVEELNALFKFCTKLTTLKVIRNSNKVYEFPENLLIGPYTVTNLSLENIVLTSSLLRWLSDCFKLKKLRLKCCVLEHRALLEIVPFKYLGHLHLIVEKKHLYRFRKNFNKINYPQVKLLQIEAFIRVFRFYA